MSRSPLCKLTNIGPTSADKLMRIGITTPEEFLACDPYDLFYQLQSKVEPKLCRCSLAALVGASQDKKRNFVRRQAVETYEARYPAQKRKTDRKGC